MANALTQFLHPETQGFGLRALERARGGGLSHEDIRQLLPSSGVSAVGFKAAEALGIGSGDGQCLTGDQIQEALDALPSS